MYKNTWVSYVIAFVYAIDRGHNIEIDADQDITTGRAYTKGNTIVDFGLWGHLFPCCGICLFDQVYLEMATLSGHDKDGYIQEWVAAERQCFDQCAEAMLEDHLCDHSCHIDRSCCTNC